MTFCQKLTDVTTLIAGTFGSVPEVLIRREFIENLHDIPVLPKADRYVDAKQGGNLALSGSLGATPLLAPRDLHGSLDR